MMNAIVVAIHAQFTTALKVANVFGITGYLLEPPAWVVDHAMAVVIVPAQTVRKCVREPVSNAVQTGIVPEGRCAIMVLVAVYFQIYLIVTEPVDLAVTPSIVVG